MRIGPCIIVITEE